MAGNPAGGMLDHFRFNGYWRTADAPDHWPVSPRFFTTVSAAASVGAITPQKSRIQSLKYATIALLTVRHVSAGLRKTRGTCESI